MAVPSGAMSDEQIRRQISQLSQALAVVNDRLMEVEMKGLYVTIEQRCDLMKYVQEYLAIPVVDFSHTLMSDMKEMIDWAAREKRAGR